MSIVFYPFFVRVQITLAYKRMWKAGAFYTDILENFWTKGGLTLWPWSWTFTV